MPERIKSWIRVCGCHISNFPEIRPTESKDSAATRGFLAASDFHERAGIRFDGLRHSLTVNKLPLAVAGDQSGFAENLQVMRNGRGGHAAHRDDLATVHVPGCGNSLENSEACLVGKGSRYLFNVRAIHRSARSVAGVLSPHHQQSLFRPYHQE